MTDRLAAAFAAWVEAQQAAIATVQTALAAGSPGAPNDDMTAAEGYRWVTRLATLALEWLVEKSDPLHPQLFVLQDEYRKLLVDNPDVHYLFCVLDDTRAYRLRGYRGECAYLGMTFGTPFGQGDRVGGGRTGTQTQTHIDEFELGPNGEVDILIAPAERCLGESPPRNAIVLEPGTAQLAIRETHFERTPERLSNLRVELVDARRRWPGAAAHPLVRRVGTQARVRRHVLDSSWGGRRRADVARRREQHEHLRGNGRLGPRRRAGRRGALPLQRRDDLSRRPLPARRPARRWW